MGWQFFFFEWILPLDTYIYTKITIFVTSITTYCMNSSVVKYTGNCTYASCIKRCESQSHHSRHDVYLQFPVYFTTIVNNWWLKLQIVKRVALLWSKVLYIQGCHSHILIALSLVSILFCSLNFTYLGQFSKPGNSSGVVFCYLLVLRTFKLLHVDRNPVLIEIYEVIHW